MIYLGFIAVCRKHELNKSILIKGSATNKRVDKGYRLLDDYMAEAGCDDYSATMSVESVVRGRKLPERYENAL